VISTFRRSTNAATAPASAIPTIPAAASSSSGTFCSTLGCNDVYYPGTAYGLT